jgi:diguanylate cyclase (GGDEF)-like protein/PAS domain S-box-containing protein
MSSVSGCFAQAYDLKLVSVTAFICLIACLTTTNLLARAQVAKRRAKTLWLGGASIVFGGGVWSVHFIAMLAFSPGFPVSYGLTRTFESMAIAVVGTGLALAAREACSRRIGKLLFGSVFLGAAIAGMHFEAIAAMHLNGFVSVNAGGIWSSLAIGGAFSLLAFARASDLSGLRRKGEVALYIFLAVLGVHFAGMAALSIYPGIIVDGRETVLQAQTFAWAVGPISVAIILTGMAAAMTDQHLSLRATQETERLLQLTEASFEGIVFHCDGVIISTNDAFARMVACEAESLKCRPTSDFVLPADIERLGKRFDNHGAGGRLEFELQAADGRRVPVEVLSRPIDHNGRPAFVSAIRDLSERKRAQEAIEHMAYHDVLTGMCNRVLFSERLRLQIALAERDQKKVAVLYLDLDRFKPVNDLLGHETGDKVLIEVGARLQRMTRSSDTVARIGGDEFVVAQTLGDAPHQAEASAGRIIEELSKPFLINGDEVEIGVSIGIAIYPDDGRTATELLVNSDTAMYSAKHEMRGTFKTFTTGLDFRLQGKRLLEQDLRHAIGRGELEVHYQPIFNCEKKILGHEALLRWNHPARGPISPAEFIPVAEESGLIRELGNWVLETACNAAMTWPTDWLIAVNVSAKQFQDPDYLQIVIDTLERTRLSPSRLELEVTESLLIGDVTKVRQTLVALKRHGVHISLDDFGTGFSSLSYLQQFPFEKLKIDRSFVANLGLNEESDDIVRAIIVLGHSLHMTVTAEGVETSSQFGSLSDLKCDQIQGYLMGRPMPKAAVDQLLEADGAADDSPMNPSTGQSMMRDRALVRAA